MPDAWWAVLDDGARQHQLSRLRELLARHTGLRFPEERWNNIERAAEAAGKQQGFIDARAWFEWFLAAPPTLRHLEPVVTQLTIGETYFFRDKPLFDALQTTLLPQLIASRRHAGRNLRLWSAGCSTGEEPYSIAILLRRLLPDWCDWDIALLGTDINAHSLAKARLGRYDNWSFRSGLPKAQDGDFNKVGAKTFAVAPPIMDWVRFAQLNLAQDVYPAADCRAMDIIFCRNVLMYLEPDCAQAIIEKLCACLVEGGWLILSAVEAALVNAPQLVSVRLDDLHLFQKCSSAQREEPAPAMSVRQSAALSAPSAEPPLAVGLSSGAMLSSASQPLEVARAPAIREALSIVKAAAPIDPTAAVPASIASVRAEADSGQLALAASHCRAAIDADKLAPDWTELLASILLEQGDLAGAEAALKRTLYLDQNRALTHVALANLLLREPARRRAAQRHFRTALEILSAAGEQDVLPDSDGMTAAQLRAIIAATVAYEISA